MKKLLLTLLTAVCTVGSVWATDIVVGGVTIIKFSDVQGKVSEGTHNSSIQNDNGSFKAVFVGDTKTEVATNNATFGVTDAMDETNNYKFSHQWKPGGGNSGRSIKVTVPSAGILYIYARTGKSGEGRTLTIGTQSYTFNESTNTAEKYIPGKYILAAAGEYEVNWTAAVNIYGMGFEPTVSVNSCGNASFSCALPLDFTSVEGVKAYMVTAETAESVTLTQINKVPANTGIFVIGEAGAYAVPVLEGEADATTSNKLVATTTAYDVTDTDNIWALSKDDGKLHPVTPGTIAAGKAYLVSTVIGADSGARTLIIDDETTGIQSVKNYATNGQAYNLAGQRVAANAKGMVIINGKKYLNK